MTKTKSQIDWLLLLPVLTLMVFSIAFVYSASANIAMAKYNNAEFLLTQHSIRVVLGVVVILLFSLIDYHYWANFSKAFIIIAAALLLSVLIFGETRLGATRWIDIGVISFQPSEFAKFALIVHFSRLIAEKQNRIKDFEKGFLPLLFWTLLICFLIALQPNFSTMMVIFIIAMMMMFIGNTNILHLTGTFFAGTIVAFLYAISAEYRLDRFKAFLGFGDVATTNETVGYQLNQSLIAIGNGGFTGLGPGQSRQSNFFLPESYGDFIFAIIGEEYGFIGLFFILALFLFILWRGVMIAKKTPDPFGYMLSIGILITIITYVFVNAGVNTGLLPTTGVPMPFVSYGGTAVLFYSAAVGTLLNISAQSGIFRREVTDDEDEASDTDEQSNTAHEL